MRARETGDVERALSRWLHVLEMLGNDQASGPASWDVEQEVASLVDDLTIEFERTSQTKCFHRIE